MAGIAEVEALVAARHNESSVLGRCTTKGRLTSALHDPDADRIPVVSAYLATDRPGRRTTRVVKGLSS